jgi:hypothetical protein
MEVKEMGKKIGLLLTSLLVLSFLLPIAAISTSVVADTPNVTLVSPNAGVQGQTLTDVLIVGTDFTDAYAISFGTGITVNSFGVNSPTQIAANITIAGDATLGTRNVAVTTPAGTGTLAGGFTVLQAAPTITLISPNSGFQGQSIPIIVITGTYFTNANALKFGAGITLIGFNVDTATQITAGITIAADATLGTRNVAVTTPGGTFTLLNGFTIIQASPAVISVSPNSSTPGKAIPFAVVITGTYFTGASAVSFGDGITVTSFVVNSSTQITANITTADDAALGKRDVSVTTPGGTRTLASGFSIIHTVTSISPRSGFRGQHPMYVSIYGTYFSDISAVSFGTGITVNYFGAFNSTWILASISIAYSATPGLRDISVTTPGGTVTLAASFTVSQDDVSIKVISPNGGESWEMRTNHTITWTSSGLIGATGNVNIQLSRNGGVTWENIRISTTNSGSLVWKVTGPATNQAKIKVLSTVYPDVFDISDVNFIIAAPVIMVTSPNGDDNPDSDHHPDRTEIWQVGTKQTITWTASPSVTGRVRIQLSRDGGQTWKTIVASTANDGAQDWVVTGPATSQARIKVISLSHTEIFDISEANFIITATTIGITSPNGGEVWRVGTKQTITWTASPSINDNVKIQLSVNAGLTWKTIKSSTRNDGSETWKVTKTITNQARIKVISLSHPDVFDISDANFTITS